METASVPLGKAMYVASALDESWLQNVQRKLFQQSQKQPDYVFDKLWGLITDPHNLRIAFARVAANRGRRTAGIDGQTVRNVIDSVGRTAFLAKLREDLRSGEYLPSPTRRVLIPKSGQPGKHRPLGIPTVRDRTVQAAVKSILEPIFEADFAPTSYGFRPGKSVHGALEHLRMLLRPKPTLTEEQRRLPYPVVIEGDIKGCFDHINHHALMERVRRRVSDPKVNRLLVAFLKAGALSEQGFLRTDDGTPQGGILSPLLANIALSAIEERYARWVWPRHPMKTVTDPAELTRQAHLHRRQDRAHHKPIFVPIRYADDFLILVHVAPGPEAMQRALVVAEQEKTDLAAFLKEQLGLELSEPKTLVTPVTGPIRFLGHCVRVRPHPDHGRMCSTSLIPRERSQRLRERIKALFRSDTTSQSLKERLDLLNPILRGWGHFYRHAWGAKRVFRSLDNYCWHTILRWLRKKHSRITIDLLIARYGERAPGKRSVRWREDSTELFSIGRIRVEQFRLAWLRPPDFAQVYGEPDA